MGKDWNKGEVQLVVYEGGTKWREFVTFIAGSWGLLCNHMRHGAGLSC